MPRKTSGVRTPLLAAVVATALAVPPAFPAAAASRPDVLLITVDTLRYDRISANGYERLTSPHIDALLNGGVRFEQARVPEPLTAPSMVSMVTSTYPQEHATSRNGLPMRQRMISFPKMLRRAGYETAAFVGNWTLKDKLSGLAEHFDDYNEVFSRKRWFGIFAGEATADDITGEALEWIEDRKDAKKPFLVWVHYVEPHAPYRLHKEFADRLGIELRENVDPSDRYDTEIAFVDRSIGNLLKGVREVLDDPPLIVFMADHGESLGEHNYWGHGRHLYDVNLRVPLGIHWQDRIRPSTIGDLASGLDVGPTILGLTGVAIPESFEGYDWSAVLLGTQERGDAERRTFHQAHKGVKKGGEKARRKGLLEVAVVRGGMKEIFRVKNEVRRLFNLVEDPYEEANEVERKSDLSPLLDDWLQKVRDGLAKADEIPVVDLDDESMDQLKALGYVE